jgi:hypothetical protein
MHHGYAVRSVRLPDGRGAHQQLASDILGIDPGQGLNRDAIVPDHINEDRLDNRRSNLRRTTQAKNSHKFSEHPGIHWNKNANAWRLRLVVNGSPWPLAEFRGSQGAGPPPEAIVARDLILGALASGNPPSSAKAAREILFKHGFRWRPGRRAGTTGVHWDSHWRRWTVRLSVNARDWHLGYYNTQVEGDAAWLECLNIIDSDNPPASASDLRDRLRRLGLLREVSEPDIARWSPGKRKWYVQIPVGNGERWHIGYFDGEPPRLNGSPPEAATKARDAIMRRLSEPNPPSTAAEARAWLRGGAEDPSGDGICWNRKTGKWFCRMNVGRQRWYLGVFPGPSPSSGGGPPADAIRARSLLSARLGQPNPPESAAEARAWLSKIVAR